VLISVSSGFSLRDCFCLLFIGGALADTSHLQTAIASFATVALPLAQSISLNLHLQLDCLIGDSCFGSRSASSARVGAPTACVCLPWGRRVVSCSCAAAVQKSVGEYGQSQGLLACAAWSCKQASFSALSSTALPVVTAFISQSHNVGSHQVSQCFHIL